MSVPVTSVPAGTGAIKVIIQRMAGAGSVWVDDVRCEEGVSRQEDVNYYYHCDYLGSPRVMTDATGSVIWRQDYYAFGSDYGTIATGNTHKFTGHVQDTTTGQYYAKARYFTTGLGRWSQPEPLLKGVPDASYLANPQQLNPYVYCLNNPLRLIDPDGNQVFDKVEDLQKAGMAAVNNKDLAPTEDATHCNAAVQQIAETGGNTDYAGLNATGIVNKLSDPKYGTTLTEQQAVDYAKAGAVVVAGITGTPGHVATVAPADMQASGSYGRNVPMVYNVGSTNLYGRVSQGFGSTQQPSYFIRNVDKAKVDAPKAATQSGSQNSGGTFLDRLRSKITAFISNL